MGRVAQVLQLLPLAVMRDSIPRALHPHSASMWCEGSREATEEPSGKGGE
jgi:hypothetical protein